MKVLESILLSIVATALAATTAVAGDPYRMADETWISLSGEVMAVNANAFILDYGDGTITVEMDDGDRDADAYKLLKGDKVTVNGVIDDGFFERTTIEAGSVYVKKLGTYFFASTEGEERYDVNVMVPAADTWMAIQGLVTEVNASTFVVNSGARRVTVDVGDLAYNPLDDEGYQKIGVGDFVRAQGVLDQEFFGKHSLMAQDVTTLVKAPMDKKEKKQKTKDSSK